MPPKRSDWKDVTAAYDALLDRIDSDSTFSADDDDDATGIDWEALLQVSDVLESKSSGAGETKSAGLGAGAGTGAGAGAGSSTVVLQRAPIDVLAVWTEMNRDRLGECPITAEERQRCTEMQELQARLLNIPDAAGCRVRLTIDTREQSGDVRELIKHLPQVRVQTVEPGDYHYSINDKPLFVVERKKISDISANISTGFPEQRKRLMECGLPRNQIMYVFEQQPRARESERKRWLPMNTLQSTAANLRQRDGFQHNWTRDMLDTAWHLLKDLESLLYYGEQYVVKGSPSAPLRAYGDDGTGSTKKVSDFRSSKSVASVPATAFERWIKQIRGFGKGISDPPARAIAKEYPCMEALVGAYKRASEKAGGGDPGRQACASMLVDLKYEPDLQAAATRKAKAAASGKEPAKRQVAPRDKITPSIAAMVYYGVIGQEPVKDKPAKRSTAKKKKKATATDDQDED